LREDMPAAANCKYGNEKVISSILIGSSG